MENIDRVQCLHQLELFSTINVSYVIENYQTSRSLLKCESPQLSFVMNTVGKDAINTFVMMWLMYISKRVKVKQNLDKEDVKLVQDTIRIVYRHWKISELAFVFLQIARGFYGPFYQSLTPEYILRAFQKYESGRVGYYQKKADPNSLTTNQQASFIIHGLKSWRKDKST